MQDLYQDPITGLPNLFRLLRCDMEKTFGASGLVLNIDLDHLAQVNENFGMEIGDAYLSELADVLRAECFSEHPDAVRFHAGGDTFIIGFGNELEEPAAARIAWRIGAQLHERMKRFGVMNAGISYGIWRYEEPFRRASDLVRKCSIQLFEPTIGEQIDTRLPDWAEDMIASMFDRVSETLRLLEHNHHLAHMDDVSGLPNHRAAKAQLQKEQIRHRGAEKPFSILFIDGDNLKRYNTLGYEHGNRMIRGIAEILSKMLRDSDQIFRWLTGDEFLVILRGTSGEEAAFVAERLRAAVETGTEEWYYPVTISIGIVTFADDGTEIETLVSMAERANAMAKMSGKNQVRMFDARMA